MFCCLHRSVALARASAHYIVTAEVICLEWPKNNVLGASGSEVDPAKAFSEIPAIKSTPERRFKTNIAVQLSLERHFGGF